MIVDGPGPCTRDGNLVFGAQNHVDGLFLPPNCCQSFEIRYSIGLMPFFSWKMVFRLSPWNCYIFWGVFDWVSPQEPFHASRGSKSCSNTRRVALRFAMHGSK